MKNPVPKLGINTAGSNTPLVVRTVAPSGGNPPFEVRSVPPPDGPYAHDLIISAEPEQRSVDPETTARISPGKLALGSSPVRFLSAVIYPEHTLFTQSASLMVSDLADNPFRIDLYHESFNGRTWVLAVFTELGSAPGASYSLPGDRHGHGASLTELVGQSNSCTAVASHLPMHMSG